MLCMCVCKGRRGPPRNLEVGLSGVRYLKRTSPCDQAIWRTLIRRTSPNSLAIWRTLTKRTSPNDQVIRRALIRRTSPNDQQRVVFVRASGAS